MIHSVHVTIEHGGTFRDSFRTDCVRATLSRGGVKSLAYVQTSVEHSCVPVDAGEALGILLRALGEIAAVMNRKKIPAG